MKKVLEEYGVLIVSAIIIMLMVVFAPVLGKHMGKGTTDTVETITAKLNKEPNEDSGGNDVSESVAFAVYCADDKSLYFYHDTKIPEKGKMYSGKIATEVYTGIENEGYSRGWDSLAPEIKSVKFINEIKPKTTNCWFDKCSSLTDIELSNLNTSEVIDMSSMFSRCSELDILDVKKFNTSNVINMAGMFYECTKLKELDVKSFDTSNVTNMTCMFSYSSGLESLDLTNFNTAKVTDMSFMFDHCSNLQTLDISSFDTRNVKSMSAMFYDCSGLFDIDVRKFNTSNVTDMRNMFGCCSGMYAIDLRSFTTYQVKDMYGMFDGCPSLVVSCKNQEERYNIMSKVGPVAPGVDFWAPNY